LEPGTFSSLLELGTRNPARTYLARPVRRAFGTGGQEPGTILPHLKAETSKLNLELFTLWNSRRRRDCKAVFHRVNLETDPGRTQTINPNTKRPWKIS